MSGSRLRILVVAAREPWPLNGGGRLLLFHVLRELAARAEVTLALPRAAEHAGELPAGLRLTVLDAGGAASMPRAARDGVVPRLARRHYGLTAGAAAWMASEAHPGRFDVALLHGAVGALLGPWCRVPWVWSPTDELVLHTIRDMHLTEPRRWPGAVRRAALYALYERWAARQAAATVFVSRVDASYARRWAGGARLEVVQNGVDCAYFGALERPPVRGTVAFVGSLEFPPNVDAVCWFARQVWPKVMRPGRRLLVVGRQPVDEVRALAGQAGVTLVADVPDVRPYLQEAAVVVVPTRKGGGLKNKILEACAAGRPVIASPRALGGLSARPGREVLVAATRGRWVSQLNALLEDAEGAAAVGRRGRAWVRQNHDWCKAGARYFELLASAAGGWAAAADAPPAAPEIGTACRRQTRGEPAPELVGGGARWA